MTFATGTKLGAYEIVGPLGKGGMGEVYRARDTKLKREVAIKVLPDGFAQDADRVARFQREAEVLASLNHPHIAAIHHLEEVGTTRFLILEIVEGETLAERVARGPIPIDEALPIAKQIAEALEAAHERGIIHRDLKPANIKITPNGNVKVLDFGLAKAFASNPEPVTLSNSPTMSAAATNLGIILGTAAYMSPEQAKGQDVDHRTDIFSFGAVLYEMLTGRQAFEGGTVTEILANVLKVDPDWSRLPIDTPAAIQRLMQRAVRKDRAWRVQTARDLVIEITEAANVTPKQEVRRSGAAARKGERVALIVALLFAFAMTAAFALLYFRQPAAALETRLDIVAPAGVAADSFDISPDGRRLVFLEPVDGGASRLWLRPLDSTTVQPLPGTEGATFPFWSPDSKSIGFFAGGKLKRVDIGGGLPQVLADAPAGRGGAWSSEGVILFAPRTPGNLLRIPASGGEAIAVTKDDDPERSFHRFPQFLPGGRQFLFYAEGSAQPVSPETAGIYLGSLDSEEIRLVAQTNTAGLYIPSGWLLYIRQGTLAAQRFITETGEVRGDPVTVANSVLGGRIGGKGAFAVSATGIIAYRGARNDRRQLTWFDRNGKEVGTLGPPDENGLADPEVSPDGRRVAVTRTVQGNTDIWIMDGTRMTRFTADPSVEAAPLWSSDGTRIAFRSNRKGPSDLYWKLSSGAGTDELLIESSVTKNANDFSPDGQFLLFSRNNAPGGNLTANPMLDLELLPLKGEGKQQSYLHTQFVKTNNRFSPDGRWVSTMSNDTGRYEIYVRPFPTPSMVWPVSSGGGIAARWRADGKELYYVAPDGKMMAVSIVTQGNTLIPGTPTALFQTRIVFGGSWANRAQYDVAPDGRFLVNQTLTDAEASPITLLQNWNPPAK